MSADGRANFNYNSILQSIVANSPEQLTALIRKIKVPMQIIGFTASGDLHVCYFRSTYKIKVVKQNEIDQVARLQDE